MRIRVEIDDSKIEAIQRWTNEPKKSLAIAQALTEFIEQRERHEFLTRVMAGKTDYLLSNDDLE